MAITNTPMVVGGKCKRLLGVSGKDLIMTKADLENLLEQAVLHETDINRIPDSFHLTPRDLVNIIGQFAWLVFNEERNENHNRFYPYA